MRALITLTLLAVAAIAGATGVAAARPEPGATSSFVVDDVPPLPAGSSAAHLWYAGTGADGWVLMHHAVSMEGPHVRQARLLGRRAIAVAAREDAVYVLLAANAADSARRDLVTLRTRPNPATRLPIYEPIGTVELLRGLPPRPFVAGLDATDDGPVVLLLPNRADLRTRGGEPDDEPARDSATIDVASDGLPDVVRRPLLVRQEKRRWVELPLPATIDPDARLRLLPSGEEDDACVLAPDAGGGSVILSLRGTEWSARPFDASVAAVQGATRLHDRLMLAVVENDRVRVVAADAESGAAPIADRPKPISSSWALVRVGSRLGILSRSGGGIDRLERIEPIDGSVEPVVTLTPPPFGSGPWLHLPFLGLITVSVLLFVVLFRTGEAIEDPAAAPAPPMPLGGRIGALAIDLLPGAVLSLLLLDAAPGDLVLLPVWSLDAGRTAPAMLALSVAVLWTTIFELFLGTTPGKRLFGGRILRADGSRPGVRAILARNLFKAITLFAPMLGIFVLLSPVGQALHDTIARTIVVRRDAQNPPTSE